MEDFHLNIFFLSLLEFKQCTDLLSRVDSLLPAAIVRPNDSLHGVFTLYREKKKNRIIKYALSYTRAGTTQQFYSVCIPDQFSLPFVIGLGGNAPTPSRSSLTALWIGARDDKNGVEASKKN